MKRFLLLAMLAIFGKLEAVAVNLNQLITNGKPFVGAVILIDENGVASGLSITGGQIGQTYGTWTSNGNNLTPSAGIVVLAEPGFDQATNSKRVALSSTAETPADVTVAYTSRAFTFTGTGQSSTVSMLVKPAKSFSIQIKATGAVTSWTAALQGSLNGANFTDLITHTSVTPADGNVAYQATGILNPSLYMRVNVSALVLGGGTNIIATVLGMQ